MNQDQKERENITKTVDVQTPPPKRAQIECPPAPIKTCPKSDTKAGDRPQLTQTQAKQLRKSWQEYSESVFSDQ